MDRSRLILLSSKLISNPDSIEVTVSGFNSGLSLTLGADNVVKPKNPFPGTLNVW